MPPPSPHRKSTLCATGSASSKTERRSGAGQLAALPTTREPVSRDPVKALDPQAQARLVKGLEFGRYYALIIGNQNYQILESLQTPRSDAERMAQVLRDKYRFNVQMVADANDVAMLRALNDLNSVLQPNDNVLIYYAGHGTRLRTGPAETRLLAAGECGTAAERHVLGSQRADHGASGATAC